MESSDPREPVEEGERADDQGEDEDPKQRRLDELADEAAEESFPASDPPAVHIEDPQP